MCRNTHHSAIAIRHQHIITNPNWYWLISEGMCHIQTSEHALFFLSREISFNYAAGFAFLNECRQLRIIGCRQSCQWMLCSDCAESNPHDGVSSRCKYVQLTILNKITVCISNLVLKRKTDAATFANPILLHCLDALRPAQTI